MRSVLYRICCMQIYEPTKREDAIQEAIFKAWKSGIRCGNRNTSTHGLSGSWQMNAPISRGGAGEMCRWKQPARVSCIFEREAAHLRIAALHRGIYCARFSGLSKIPSKPG